MKQTNTFIVLRDKEGNYLAEFQNNERVLAYSEKWSDDIEDALNIPEEYYYGKDKEKYLIMAKMFDAEPIKVQAEYTLTTLDGQELPEPVKTEEDELEAMFNRLLFSAANAAKV
ncbi:hypothetical protein [Streptococcus suis]|uniref:hypothetical protein n=1 Tax=Streptococcus suis TaxID=1307 RepID=UPI0005CDE55B|nr:hypothetical protein [Streptococcus suis]NQI21293.1 hypothetical protein [Streptococcus suis]CYT70348.1 phage protein [Streptococcus suis]